jgi:hypothetical protein
MSAAAIVAVLAAYIASAWNAVAFVSRSGAYSYIGWGQWSVGWRPSVANLASPPFGWSLYHVGRPLIQWRITSKLQPSGDWGVVVPLWVPLLITTLSTVALLHRDRRIPPGHCTVCRYDLSGLAASDAGTVACPECGVSCHVPPA